MVDVNKGLYVVISRMSKRYAGIAVAVSSHTVWLRDIKQNDI